MKKKLILLALSAISAISAHAVSTATHDMNGASNLFNIGAGVGTDGSIFDNRLLQTFTSSTTGTVSSISLLISKIEPTTADLRVSIVGVSSGQPVSTLDTSLLRASSVGTSSLFSETEFSHQVFFSDTITVSAGVKYGFLLSTDSTEANFRFYGSRNPGYAGGELWDFQNSGPYTQTTGDLFFDVGVTPVPEPSSYSLLIGAVIAIFTIQCRSRR